MVKCAGTPVQLPEVLIGYQVTDDSQHAGQGEKDMNVVGSLKL